MLFREQRPVGSRLKAEDRVRPLFTAVEVMIMDAEMRVILALQFVPHGRDLR
jgi:hypothetical protein